jgi:hypothetical protein
MLATVSLLLLQRAHATLYLLEPFDYPAGPLTNAIPWSTNGTAVEANPTLLLVSGDLFYPPLTDPAPVNHCRMQFSTNVKGCRQISATPLGSPSADTSVYVSFIFYKATTNGTGNAPIIGVNTTAANTINQAASDGMVLYHQQSGVAGSGTYRLGIRIGGGAVAATYPLGTQVYTSGNTSTGDTGQTNLIVMKYHFIPGSANDTVALWVNPDPSSFGGNEPASTTNDVAEVNFGAADAAAGLQYFQVRGGATSSSSGTIQIDNIRVGSTWADVTPACITAGTTDPANQSVSPGQMATFSVTGSGLNPTYQWQTNHGSGWVNIGGATSSSYITPPEVLTDNGLQFRCVVSVACDNSSVTSAAATLTVQNCVAAGVTDPTDQTVDAGQMATFSVTATGTSPSYQWQTNNGSGWVDIGGAASASYTTRPEVVADNNLQFRCVVHVACGGGSFATSAAATLHVTCTTAGVTNPQNQTVIAGQKATFSVTGSGSSPTFQWATNNGSGWFNIPGATNASYTTPSTSVSDYGLMFQCTVSVACDNSTVTSALAYLVVNCDAAGTTDPAGQSVGAGQTATFSVTGSGSLPTYQWQTNNGGGWVNIGGATNASYTTPPEVVADNGLQFRCAVSVACNSSSVTSGAATLNVYPGNAMFRSIASGNINDPNTWEQSFNGGSTWTTPALYAPVDVNSTNVTVRSGHTVANNVNTRLDQTVVQAGGQITINSGTTLTITNGPGTDLDISGTVDVAGALNIVSNAPVVVESGGVLKTEQGGTYTGNGTLTFNSGSKYQHNYTTGAGTIPTATWNAGSSCEVVGFTTDTTTLAGTGQSFYNFTWNCPNQTSIVPLGGTIPTAVNGDFTCVSTGTGEVRLSNNNNPTSNISGNLNLLAGRLTLANGNGRVTLNVAGNVSITGGTLSNNLASSSGGGVVNFVKVGTQTFTNGGSVLGAIRWVVANGSTLKPSSTLGSSLTLAPGGRIQLGMTSPLFNVNGNVTNNNNTVVIDLGGASLATGTYQLMTYSGLLSGQLNPGPALINGSVSGTAAMDISTPGQINLAVYNGQPRIMGFGLSGTTLTVAGGNGTPGVTCGILASTNLTLPLTQWAPVLRGALFNGSGNLNASLDLTNTLDAHATQQFFRLQEPSP